jgi:pimeloyl-ACP methyl ester carboxylesterase
MTAVIFLPGIGVPAHLTFAPLLAELSHSAPVVTKELEVYADDQPPEDYRLDLEVDGLDRFATGQGFDRFHLYGHSIGGAIVLAYVARHPDRVASAALHEPATDFSAADRTPIVVEPFSDLPEDQFARRFLEQLVRPGVPLPPSQPPRGVDPEMAKRPAGIRTAIPAMYAHRVDEDDLRRYRGPAYFAHGSLSHERWEAMAERIPHVLGDCTVERYEGRSHLDVAHQAEPRRFAAALTTPWKRADG